MRRDGGEIGVGEDALYGGDVGGELRDLLIGSCNRRPDHGGEFRRLLVFLPVRQVSIITPSSIDVVDPLGPARPEHGAAATLALASRAPERRAAATSAPEARAASCDCRRRRRPVGEPS